MGIFQHNWKEFQQTEFGNGNAYNEFLSHFPSDIDFSTTSLIPEFREPLIQYFVSNPELFNWAGIPLDGGFYNHLNVLEQELVSERLIFKDFGYVFDFGMGIGTSTKILSEISRSILGVDMNPNCFYYLNKRPTLSGQYMLCDGISFLEKIREPKYDLITSFAFGFNDMPKAWMERFYDAALGALKPDGKIMVNSYLHTIDQVRGFLGIPYRTEFNPRTIITTHEDST